MNSSLDFPPMRKTGPEAGVVAGERPQDSLRGRGRVSPARRLVRLFAVVVVLLSFSGSSRGQGDFKAVLDRVKDATVYIKLRAGQMGGSGSGFVMKVTGDTVLIMTNRHVAAPDIDELPKGAKVELSVVFWSGTAQEQELPAKLLAFDERDVRDLAVLEVKGVRKPPTTIPADVTAVESEYFETMEAYALGFPLGGMMSQIAGNIKANPAVTVNKMTISSMRRDESGKLARIQFAGSMIEGNSGGPVVDAKGRLVGVVVSRIRGENVGFAIPPSVIAAFLAGDVGDILNAELLGSVGPDTQLKLLLRLVDPLNRLKGVSIRYARQAASAAIDTMKPEASGNYAQLPGGTNVALMLQNGTAGGTLAIPIKSPEDRNILLQFLVTDNSGRLIVASKPFATTLPDRPGKIAGLRMEAKPLTLAKWSCEANLGEGIKMVHKPGTTIIDLPAGVPINNAPQYGLLNAPCALVKVEGDFIAAVKVEDTFDPGGEGVVVPSGKKLPFSFQSAGIIIWQDEKNFVRMERSKGSDGKIGYVNRVLVEVYKNGREAAIHYIDVPEVPIVVAAIRKGGSIQLLFAMPPKALAQFYEMAVDFEKEVFVGVAAANLSKRAFQAKLENFKLTTLAGQDIEVKPLKKFSLVEPPFVKLPDGTRLFEGAGLRVASKDASLVAPEDMANAKGEWSANKQLLWKNKETGQALVLDLPLDEDGKFEVKGKFTMAPDYAVVKLEVDGKPLNKGARIDFYSQEIKPTKLMSLGTFALNKGKHRLTITVFGKNAKSSGYRFGLDEIQLVPAK